MTVFERIENLRKSKKISQGNLEKELGFSNGSISKWKTSMPNPERLQKLANYFEVTVDYLISGEDDTESALSQKNNSVCFKIIKQLCKKEGISIFALEKELGYSNGSLSQANKIPSSRIYDISKRFNVSMEYLMTGEDVEQKYYINDKTAAIAQDIFKNKELGLLFDSARDAEPEDLEAVHNMLLALKRKERGNID